MPIPLRFFLLALVLTACQTIAPVSGSAPDRVADKTGEQWAQHDKDDVKLGIAVPAGWESYNTDAGIVLNEFMGSGTPDQPLKGFLIHIFVPSLVDFRMPLGDENMAWYILMQVVHNPGYVGNAVVSNPVAFDWDHHDAAYYLLNNRDGTMTLLLALALPDHSNLVVSHVSLPVDQTNRIQTVLPDLLRSLTIDGATLEVSVLRKLFQNLEFPASP